MKDPLVHLEDILSAISKIQQYTKGFSEEYFSSDEKTQDTVIRQLIVIGEAANKVNQDAKEKISNIQWRDIIGMRNILVHDYEVVQIPEIWKVIKSDLTPFLNAYKNS